MELRIAVFSVLIASALSGPLKNLNSNSKCAVQCTSKDKFGYRVGTVYEYSYEATTKTGISGATEDQGGLKITAKAEIEVLSKCELLLTVKNSDILASDPKYPSQFTAHPQRREFQAQFEKHSLRFSFQDGVIEELCPDDDESDWTLNFKRGILSAFQNSMEALDRDTDVFETDVTGKCPTSYNIKQEGWQSIKIRKTKDLSKCVNRHGFQTSAQSTIYSVPSSVQSLPLLESTQECNLEVSTQGRVENTVCHEFHLFKPFSKGGHGAITEVTQKLAYVTDRVGGRTIRDPITRRSSLLYHHHEPEVKTTDKKAEALNKLSEICTTTKDGITADTPRIFSELVYTLKQLSADDLADVYQQSQMDSFCLENSDRVKKFYTDAVPMVGTTAAVEQIAQLILRNEITGTMAEIWLSSLSLVQNPSKEMLQQIAKLMDLPESHKVYLPASVMVNTFCKDIESCESVAEIQTILRKLKRAIGSGCIITESNYVQVLTALRAIGNIEQSSSLESVVTDCYQKKDNEDEVRAAAIEAYRRMSCSVDRNNLMSIYKDTTEDSELRILAYIQVMKCPTEGVISQIKETLGKEEVNQVGSYVWTHLTNLMETSLIYKQSIQEILSDEVLKKEFDLDKRKFSRNYEWSYFSEALNAGAGLESNIIFSQQSFVPRSAMVNLTVDLFGHSVNLFELGGRVEGLEKILMENFAKTNFGAKQDLTPEQKQSRDVDFNKVEKLNEKFGKTEAEMKAALFVRMFGNEITYYNTKQSANNDVNQKKFNFLEMFMNLAKDHQFSQKMSQVLLDSSIITPTVAGIPLNLKVTATSTVDMNASGKMDLRSPSKSVVMEGSIAPSGAVEVSSVMSVDAFITRSGLKMVSNFHSSTAISAKFELDNNQELTMEFSIPKEKSEIVNAKSQFFIVHGGEEHEQRMITKNRINQRSCSGATLARVTGVEFCFDMSLPGDVQEVDAPHFPLTGPAKFSLEVLKRDTHTSYKYEFKAINDKKKTHIMMMYDTPGSKIERRTGFNIEVNHNRETMEMSVTSPWKTAKVEGNFQNSKRKMAATGVVTVDAKKLYQAEGSVLISETKSSKSYKPKLEIIRPDADPIVLGGDITYKPGKVMTSKLVLSGVRDKPASLDLNVRFTKGQYGFTGSLLYDKTKKYNADMNFEMNNKGKRSVFAPRIILSSPDQDYVKLHGNVIYQTNKGKVVRYDLVLEDLFRTPTKLKGESSLIEKGKRTIHKGKLYLTGPQKISTKVRYMMDQKLRTTSTSVKLDYNFQKIVKALKDSMQFNSKFLKKSVKKMQRVTFTSNMKSARFSEYNNQVDLKVDHRPNSKVDANLIVDYGRTYTSKVNKQRLSILSATKYQINEKKGTGVVNYNVTFQLPAEKLDSYISGQHKYSKTGMNSDLHIRYDNKKAADVIVNFNDQSKKHFKYSGDVALKYGGRHIQLSGMAVEKDKEYTTKWDFQHQDKMSSTVSASYGWPKDAKREFDSRINIYEQQPVEISSSVMMDSRRPEINTKVKVGQDFYVLSGNGVYDGDMYIQGQGKLGYPARQITIETEGGYRNELYSGKLGIDWDAKTKSSDSRIYLEGSLRNNTIEDFDVSSKLEYPGREVSARVAHYSKDKIQTSVSVGWQKDEAVGVTVKFDKDFRKYRHSIEGSVAVTTPWKEMMEFEIGGNHAYNKKRIDLGATLTWNKGKTVAFQYESTLPMDYKDIDVKLGFKTPVPQLGNPSISLQSTMSDDLVDQRGILKLTWGTNQFVEIETNGKSLSQERRRNLHRNLAVMTSFEGYKQITLNWTHEDDFQKYLSKATYTKDGIKYLYILDMNHMLNGWSMQNSGTFDIKSPHDSLKITWTHRNVDKDLETIVNTLWGRSGQKFFAKATGRIDDFPHRKLSGSLEMKVPSSEFSNLNIDFKHEDKTGLVKSFARIVANKENIGTVEVDYKRQMASTDFDVKITSKFMKDFIIEGKTRHAHPPMTGSLKIEWNPRARIILDGSVSYNQLGVLDSKLVLTTPFRGVDSIVFIATHKMVNLDWVAMAELEFASNQKIKSELRYNTGVEKLARLELTTPFPQFSKLSTGAYFKFLVSPTQWENKVDFEIVPLVGKMNVTTKWRHDLQTDISMKIETPFPQVPSMETKLESKVNPLGKRESKMMLEYLPDQRIELSSSYVLTNEGHLDGSVAVKTPFNEEVYASYLQGGYSQNQLNGFQRRVQLKYQRSQNIVIDTAFGTKPKIFGILKVEMPVRGYETVKLSFDHEGTTLKNFQTNVEYDTNGKKIELQTLFNMVGDYQGKLRLTSPFETLKEAQVTFSHEGTMTSFKSHSGAIFNDFKADANAVFTHNDLQTTGSLSFKSTIDEAKDLMLSFNKDGTWNKLSFNGEAGYEVGSKYVVAVKHSYGSKDAATDIVLQTPLVDDIIINVNYDNRKRGFVTIVKGSVGTDNSVTIQTTYKLRNLNLDLDIDLTTVISGQRNTATVTLEHKGDLNDFACTAKAKTSFIENFDDSIKISFKGSNKIDDIDARIVLKDTWKPLSIDAGLKSTRNGDAVHTEATYNDNTITSDLTITDTKNLAKLSARTKIEGYENIDAEIENVNREKKSTSKVTITAPNNNKINVELDAMFKSKTEFGADIKISTSYDGFESITCKVDHTGDYKDFVSKVEIAKSGMETIKAEARMKADIPTSIVASISFVSGIEGAENIAGTFKHSGDLDNFKCMAKLIVPNMAPIDLNIEFTNNPNTVNGKSQANAFKHKVAFTSGFEGFEKIGYSMEQVTQVNSYTQKIVIDPIYNMKTITQEIVYTVTPERYEAMYKLTGMEKLKDINLRLLHRGDVFDFENVVTVSVQELPSMKSMVTLKINDKDNIYTNIKGEARFTSGIEGAENVYLTIEHSSAPGKPFVWNNKAILKPPMMEMMTLATTLDFKPYRTVKASADFTSQIPGFTNVGFSTANKVLDVEKRHVESQTEIRLDRIGSINVDLEGKAHFLYSGESDSLLKLNMMTPFEKIRTFNTEYSVTSKKTVSSEQEEEISQTNALLINLNGIKYWDTQAAYKMTGFTTFRYDFSMMEPKQMEYNYNLQTGDPYVADIYMNWDKNEPNSNLRIESKFMDMNDLKVRVIYPTRTASVEAAFTGELEKLAKLIVTWDEVKGQAVGIETKWRDQRPNLDTMSGSVKVVSPWRSVEAIGSLDNSLPRKTMEGTVFWDAEDDKSKKVTVATEFTPDDNGYSSKIQLFMPAIGKELTFSRQMTEKEGAILYQCRNEFSYNNNPSKTIVMTTKLEDVSEYGSSNHTFTVGISQEATRVDMSMMTHLGTSDQRDSTGMLLTYKTSRLQTKNILLLAEIDKIQKKLILITVGPVKSAGIVGQVRGDSPKTVSIKGLFDLEDIINADVTLDSNKKAMEVQMKYDRGNPNKVLHIAAKYPSHSHFETQIYRTGDKPQITDCVIKVNLRTSRILHSKINWRPEAAKELSNFVADGIEHYGKSFNTEFIATANEMEDEMTAKYSAISSELETELNPYLDSLSKNLRSVQRQLNKVKEHLDKMYANNDMYVKDVTDNMREKSSNLMKMYRQGIVQMKDIVGDMRQQIEKIKDLRNYPFEEKYKIFVNEMTTKIQTLRQEMVDALKKDVDAMSQRMKATVEDLRKDIRKLTDKMSKKLTELLDTVLEKAEVKELLSYLEDILKNLPDSSNLPDFDWQHYLNKINKAIKHKLSQIDLEKTYNEVLEATKSAVMTQLEPVMQDEKVKELIEMADQLQKKIMRAYKRWNIEKTIKSYLLDLYNDLGTYIKEDIAQLKFLHWDKNRIIAFDPENGNIEFELYLPTPADALESIPKKFDLTVVKKIDGLIKKFDSLELPKMFDFSIWDLYYRYKPSMDPADWVPPFDTYALMAGDQHFITFDKRQIDFAGQCSYVLVKDMVNDQFTVIMNYNNRRRPAMESLLILAEGKSVEIRPDFSVKLDNRPTELPIKYQKLSVIRDGNLVQIDTGKGLIISGNMANQHVIFKLSGWYFGKVAGLLGSYDNEQYDDMIDSDGKVTDNVNSMVQTWEVANRCRNPSNLVTDVEVEEGKKGYMKCSKLFKESDSTLRPCFRVVEPDYYMKVCMSEMQTSKGDGCNAVSAYVKQCREEGVMLWEPKSCLTCSAPNKEMYEGGEFIKLSPSNDDFKVPSSADVVFVVEQTSCNSNPADHLGDLVDNVEQALKKEGLNENRYGLIGFGGTPRPAFGRKSASLAHTFEGSIFSESNNFAKGKETLSFKSHFTDPIEAILTAADMPFRAGVSKTVVLLHCGGCEASENVAYNHVKDVLLARGITLHIIRDQDIRLTGNSSPKDTIYGFDNQNKYMIKPMNDESSKDISIPSDSCVSLSLKTDGSVFHASGLTDSKIRNRKWFLKTVSQRISQTAKPEECQVCQCVADHTGMAKSVCRTCYTTLSDYLPNWWATLKHPAKVQNQFENNIRGFFGDDVMDILTEP